MDWYVDWIRICIKLIVYYHNPENTSHFDCLSTHLYVQDWNPWARSSAKPINSLGPSDSIQWHRSGSTLARVMAWCLMAPSHHLYIDLSSLRSSEIHLRAASQEMPRHSFSQPPVHLCFAQAIKPNAHPKITLIFSFSWGFSSKVAFCTP